MHHSTLHFWKLFFWVCDLNMPKNSVVKCLNFRLRIQTWLHTTVVTDLKSTLSIFYIFFQICEWSWQKLGILENNFCLGKNELKRRICLMAVFTVLYWDFNVTKMKMSIQWLSCQPIKRQDLKFECIFLKNDLKQFNFI